MACIDDIVGLGICDDEVSTSGFYLMKAPGMSPKNTQNIATEQYTSGTVLLNTIKTNAINAFRNDFLGTLQANNIVTTITHRQYDSARFNTSKSLSTYAGYRGQVLRAVTKYYRGNMRQMKIHKIQSYPLVSGDGEFVIIDSENGVQTTTTYPVTFTANALNTHELPTPYIAKSRQVSILVDNTDISFCSTDIMCKVGCQGEAPNECGTLEGWDGVGFVKKEGYGLNVIFSCECDYDTLICDLSKSFTGELIWMRMQEYFYEEQYKSNRFSAWTTYNRDDIWNAILPDLRERYANKFNSMVRAGIFNVLQTYKDDCLNCRGIRKVVNI